MLPRVERFLDSQVEGVHPDLLDSAGKLNRNPLQPASAKQAGRGRTENAIL
jgi:hypothetical protein